MRKMQVLLVTSTDCHLCEHARRVLACMAQRYPLSVSEVLWASEEGRRLAARDGIVFPPGVYLDGSFWGYGRLSEGRLEKWLREQRA